MPTKEDVETLRVAKREFSKQSSAIQRMRRAIKAVENPTVEMIAAFEELKRLYSIAAREYEKVRVGYNHKLLVERSSISGVDASIANATIASGISSLIEVSAALDEQRRLAASREEEAALEAVGETISPELKEEILKGWKPATQLAASTKDDIDVPFED